MKNNQLLASYFESGFYAFDGVGSKNVFYFITFMNEKFDSRLFEESLFQVCLKFPKLRSKFVKGIVKDKWKVIEKFSKSDLQIEYYDVDGSDKKSFEDNVLLAFNKHKDLSIDILKNYPMKFIIYQNKSVGLSAVLTCFHHAFTDGRGGCDLLNYIGEVYNSLSKGKKVPPFQNYYNLDYLSKKLYNKINGNDKVASKENKSPEDVLPIFNSMFDELYCKDKLNPRKLKIIEIDSEKYDKLKLWAKRQGLTINDFMILIVLLFAQKYNRKLPHKSEIIGCSFTADTRKFAIPEPHMIGNYSGYENFLISSEIIENRNFEVFKMELNDFKNSKSFGMDFVSIMKKFDIVPTFISRPITRKVMAVGIKDRIKNKKAVSFSNCGDMTKTLDEYNDIMYKVIFVPNVSIDLMPQLGVSSYNNTLTISIAKEIDANGIVNRLSEEIEALIVELIGLQ